MGKVLLLHLTSFGATYNCGAYGAGAYDSDGACTPTSQTPQSPVTGVVNSGALGGLANTGWNILIPVIFGMAVLFASLILLFKRLRRRRLQAQPDYSFLHQEEEDPPR
ncbi:hypothetical protein JNJ66_00665 [Candidatus Saccharibacteria bacterium]|nr:hypothetical protein [Candidatus Saccharibacteria bacterium]